MSGDSHDRRKLRRMVEGAVDKIVSQKYTTSPPAAPAPAQPKGKPIDRWLGIFIGIVGILLYLLPKTPLIVGGCLLVIFALAVRPIWNFWWIENRWWRRIGALSLLALGLSALGYFTWQSRTRTINHLTELASKRNWNALAKNLDRIETDHDPGLRDVDLYFRGLLYSNSHPAPDPERYLAQIPSDSDLFESAQEIRFHNYSASQSVELGTAIMNSLDRASLRNGIYYRLRLELSPDLTFDEISAIYDEFATRYKNLFDFSNMKSNITVYRGIPMSIDVKRMFEAPGCVLLFLYAQLNAAHKECLLDQEKEALNRYDMLLRNVGNAGLGASAMILQISTAPIEQRIEEIRNRPNGECSNKANKAR